MALDGPMGALSSPKLQFPYRGHQSAFAQEQKLPIWKASIWMVHIVSFVTTCSNLNSPFTILWSQTSGNSLQVFCK